MRALNASKTCFEIVIAALLLLAPSIATAHGAHEGHALQREALIADFLDDPSGTVPLETYTSEIREFTLEIREIHAQIAPGVRVRQWAFGLEGETPTVPGPELRVKEGDLVRITLRNTHDQPHTLHLHGITSLAQEMDGVPHTSREVLPGEAYTYEFVADEAGTHAYHCHVQTNLHMDMGMYGSLVVEPRHDDVPWDEDIVMVLDEWDTRQDPAALVHASDPNYFLVNGKAYPHIPDVHIEEGEVALLRFVNMGYAPHSLHLHGMSFLVIAKDGYDLPAPYRGDTLPILPGERYDVLVQGRDGDFPFHDHIVSNATNNGVYPGGMHFMVTGSPARRARLRDAQTAGAMQTDAQAAQERPLDSHHGNSHRGNSHHGHHAPGASGAATPSLADLPVHDGQATVRITDFAFDAPVLRVKAGTVVTWINETRVAHTITEGVPGTDPSGRAFDSSGQGTGRITLLRAGQSWSHAFETPGEFTYYCLPHTYMTGLVIVEPAD